MLHKTLIALAAAVALGCVPMATNALAADNPAGHGGGGHGGGGHAVGGHSGGHVMGGHPGWTCPTGGHPGGYSPWWSCRSIRWPLLRGRRTDLRQLRWLQRSRLWLPGLRRSPRRRCYQWPPWRRILTTGGNVTMAVPFPDCNCGRCTACFAVFGGRSNSAVDYEQLREPLARSINSTLYRAYGRAANRGRVFVREARRGDQKHGLALNEGQFASASNSSLNSKRLCCSGGDCRLSR